MKKLFSFIVFFFIIFFFVVCLSKFIMDGEYYEIGDYGINLVIIIKGDKGIVDVEVLISNMMIDIDI